jgi:hypothetical protein
MSKEGLAELAHTRRNTLARAQNSPQVKAG